MQPPFSILRLDHVVLRVRDVAAMQAFYCGVLGCRLERERPSACCNCAPVHR
jgi:glyoxylase I family protein